MHNENCHALLLEIFFCILNVKYSLGYITNIITLCPKKKLNYVDLVIYKIF